MRAPGTAVVVLFLLLTPAAAITARPAGTPSACIQSEPGPPPDCRAPVEPLGG
jgi:hypothetical protein